MFQKNNLCKKWKVNYGALLFLILSAEDVPKQKWNWPAILAFLLILLILLLLLALYLFCRKCKRDKAEAVDGGTGPAKVAVAPSGHGTVRSYSDQGAGEADNSDFDLRHLMKYMYTERTVGVVDLEHGQEHANIRSYKDPGVRGTDNHQFDLTQLMTHT